MITAFYLVLALAIVTMGYALVQVIQLRALASGGHLGKVVQILLAFIVFFFAAYLAAPLLVSLNLEVTALATGGVFLLGALFVVIVLKIIRSLIERVFKELNL